MGQRNVKVGKKNRLVIIKKMDVCGGKNKQFHFLYFFQKEEVELVFDN